MKEIDDAAVVRLSLRSYIQYLGVKDMKYAHTVLTAICLTLVLSIVGVASLNAQKIEIPHHKKEVLDNGLTVLLMEYHKLPLIELRMTTKGGTSYDPTGYDGLASLTAGLLRKGTTTRTATQISEEIDFIGGTLSASTGSDYFVVTSEVLKKDFDKGFSVFSDILLHPAFAQEEIERERSQRLATIEQYKENPGTVASIYFNKVVYGSHPYGRQSIGTVASLKKITGDDIEKFYKEVFLPNTSILTVVGDFDTKEMLAKVKSMFNSWVKETPKSVKIEKPVVFKGRKVFILNKSDATQTQVRIGNIGVERKNPDYFAITAANTILGGGFTSRLTEEIRVRRSLTYGVSSSFPSNLEGGTYLISTFTKNQTAREIIDVALNEVKKFRESGATQQELLKAQNYIAGGFSRGLQAPEALAAQISDVEFYQFPGDYLQTYIQKLKAVTSDDVKRIANKYLPYDDIIVVVLTPAKETRASLDSLGKVEEQEFQNAID
jgi:zinc protease